jgi:hypothetical protein
MSQISSDESSFRQMLASMDRIGRCRFPIALAFNLTISARDTYKVGTEAVVKPSELRRYNEVMHRVLSNAGQLLDVRCEDIWCLDLVVNASRDLPLIAMPASPLFAA